MVGKERIKEREKNKRAVVKTRNITVVLRFFEMDFWDQVKDN